MKQLTVLGIALGFAGALTYGASINGKLMDEQCWDKSSQSTASETSKKSREEAAQKCAPTAATKAFVVDAGKGKVYKLDTEGNTKAASEFSGGSLTPDKDGDVHVNITGTVQGDTVKVDNIAGRGKKKG